MALTDCMMHDEDDEEGCVKRTRNLGAKAAQYSALTQWGCGYGGAVFFSNPG